MFFIIRKNSTLPELIIPIDEDFMDKYGITDDMMCDAVATFSMIDSNTDLYKIANREARIKIEDKIMESSNPHNFFIIYDFSKSDTKKAGNFIGEFKLDFLDNEAGCGTLTVPNEEDLCIKIHDSITRTD